MKIIYLLLSVYVVVLTSVPCCVEDNCKDEVKTEQTDPDHHHEDTDKCKDCSPFFTCSACSSFAFNHHIVSIQPVLNFIEKKHKTYLTSWPNSFYTEFWQPPKIS